ncbi:MAG: hypothetical protein IKA80_00645 [Spirochaetaceae bacterium]|nr:hypothetical protein [Spirochaetaceae bacterium]
MKKIYQYMLMAAALLALASCSQPLVNSDSAGQSISVGGLQFVVGDFPVFGGGTQTRAIGTQDEGKTEWENGDKILVHLYSDEYGQQAVTLTFENGGWKSDGGTFDYPKDEKLEITAVYAPDCEIKSDGSIGLASGKLYGMAEYITAKTSVDGLNVSISFKDVTRTYSRLRIAGLANQTLTVTTTDFTPAGATEVATAAYTLTTDNNGNAFLYGVFAEGATVSVKQGDIEIGTHGFASATEECVSYALDAMSPYVYDEATNTYTVYTAKGLLDWSEAARADLTTNLVLAADITLTGENNWTTIGEFDEIEFDEDNTEFIGTIDGAGHTITGLNIKMEEGPAGFISALGKSGHIKNLLFTNAEIQGEDAAVVAAISRGIVENCSVISECSVSGIYIVGGIVGWNFGLVSGCNNDASIYNSGYSGTGGIVGRNNNGTVMGCINSGSVQNSCTDNSSRCGGIMGSQFGETSSVSIACGNIGEVSSIRTDETGGVAGTIIDGSSIALWTKATTESDASGDGIGDSYYSNELSVSCHSFADAPAVTAEKIAEMNAAIAAYNASAAEGKTCPYTWQVGTDGYPTLVKSE